MYDCYFKTHTVTQHVKRTRFSVCNSVFPLFSLSLALDYNTIRLNSLVVENGKKKKKNAKNCMKRKTVFKRKKFSNRFLHADERLRNEAKTNGHNSNMKHNQSQRWLFLFIYQFIYDLISQIDFLCNSASVCVCVCAHKNGYQLTSSHCAAAFFVVQISVERVKSRISAVDGKRLNMVFSFLLFKSNKVNKILVLKP